MKHRLTSLLLAFLLLVSLIPVAAAKPANEIEATTDSYTGTLNTGTDLLFDFSNNTDAQTRYKSSAYGGYNFDQESKGYWATGYNGSKTAYSISNANGTLRLTVTDGADANGTYGPWLKVTNTYGTAPSYSESSRPYYPLNFNPKSVKFVTIKFKMSGCSIPSGTVPRLVFEYYYTKDGTYSYANDMRASFVFENGYYQTVTIPVSSKLANADSLKGFGFRFQNVKASSGTIYIDHIYIGASGSTVMSSHSDKTFLSQSINPIVSGVNEAQVYFKNQADSTQFACYMATISPSAKYTLKASYPGYYTKGSTAASRKTLSSKLPLKGAKTTEQAAAYEAATGETVYLAINADFFNMDTYHPRGQLAMEGNVIQTYGTRVTPYFAVLKDGTYAIRAFGTSMDDVAEAVAGHHWLVRNGSVITNNDVELAPRTAIGLKADGTVLIFTTDGRQEPYSVGTTIQELADLMHAAGCVNAINLDGGGSTTFASRYNNGASALSIRNSPSDSTGERTVTSTLLLVAQSCKHTYNTGYAVNADGTHSVSCSSCANKISMPHSYKSGVCVCGEKQHLGSGLYFGFGNSANDRYRYNDPAYKYNNFDLTDNGTWNKGCWYTGYTATSQDYTIDNTAGTLTVKVSNKYSGSEANGNLTYGPWLKITNGDGVGPDKTTGTHRPLNYKPANVEEVRIRFKITGCTVPSGKTPRVYFEYYYTEGGTYTGATDMYANYTFTDGEYVTVTIPASNTLKAADVLCGFGLRFQHIMSTSGGKLILDYIYVGEKASDTLLFDFSNNAAAKARYQDPAYNFINFDTASKGYWASYYNGENTNFTVNNSEGTLNVTVTDGYSGSTSGNNVIYGPWIKTTNTYGKFTGRTTQDYFPLSYDPANCEYFQIRFKTTNCEVAAGKTANLVLEYYYTDNGTYTYANDVQKTYTVKNGEYQILTIPVSAKFKAADEILCFGLRFQHVLSTSGGSINIDYIAIGKNDALPNPLVTNYTVTFANEDGTVLTTQTVAGGTAANYTGATPTKAYDKTSHYTFSGWVDANSKAADLSKISANITVYAYFTATAHSYTSKITTAATCTKAGVKTHTCTCGYSYTEALSATGHTEVKDAAVAATCTTAGKTEGSHCSVCNAVIKAQTAVPATGHSYTSKVTTAATCTKNGVKTFTCSKCSHSYTEAIAATDHTVVIDAAVPATCTNSGLTEGKHCSVCNTVLVEQESVARLGHDYGNYVNNGETHTATCSRCNKTSTANHTYTNGTCICGAKEIVEPILDESIKILHTLDLASDISVTFAVAKTALANYDSYYLECVLPEYSGNAKIGTSTVEVQPVVSGNYYYFTLTGITAVRMGDMVEAVLHMTKGGQEYYSKTDSYSVATYAYGMLNSSKDAKMLTLCADLLRYGAEAQAFKGYRTDALVDAAMTEVHRGYLSDTSALSFTATDSYIGDLANPTVTWVGKTLDLGSKVGMKFVFNAKNYSGDLSKLSMKVTYQGSTGETKSVTVTGIETYNANNKQYSFTFYGLLASELRTIVDVAIYNGNTQLSETLRYSAESYAAKTGTTALAGLTKALFAYSDSAKAFFAK